MMNRILLLLLFALGIESCSTDPPAILFGKDECAYCGMVIMDKKFGSVLMTPKGKRFPYDSGECLVRQIREKKAPEGESFVINTAIGERLVPAKTAIYLHGENIRSPMGGNLASFSTHAEAEKMQTEFGGKILDWNEVLALPF